MGSLAAESLQSPIHSTGLWEPPHAVLPAALSPPGSLLEDREVCGAVFGADPSGWGGCTLQVSGICLSC